MFGLPKRWEMAILLLSGITIVYTLRVNMSVAAVKMKDDLNWSEAEKGYVLSAFYWGYTLGQLPASRLAQSYGAKWLFGLSVAVPSLLTCLVPLACRHSLGMALFIRVLIGFFESATFPCVFHFFPIWVPISEKTFMIPFIVSGMYVGEIIGFSLSGALAGSKIYINGDFYGGWPSIFYVFGLSGLLWFPFWIYAAYESPAAHPTITREEVLLINRGKDLPYGENRNSDDDGVDAGNTKPLLYEQETESEYAAVASPEYVLAEARERRKNRSVSSTDSSSIARGILARIPTTSSATSADTSVVGGDLEARVVVSPLVSRVSATPLLTPAGTRTLSREENNHTSTDRTLSKEEWQVFPDDMLLKGNKYSRAELTARTPWKQFFVNPVARALLICGFVYGWIGFTLLSEMPSYLTDILGFDLGSAGILCVFPYLALFFATLGFAQLFDFLQREHDWSVDRVRKTAMFIAYIGSGTVLVICGFLPDKYAAYTFMIFTQIFYAAAQAGLGCIWTDVAPLYSSSINSLANTMGAVAGIVGPIVVSSFVGIWPGAAGWQAAFILTLCMGAAAMVTWMVYVKAEIVPVLNTPAALEEDDDVK